MGPAELFSQFFFVGVDVLATKLHPTTKAILAQIGDAVHGVVDSDAVEWWQHAGFSSRAARATAGKAGCQAIGFKRGKRDIIIATRDLRGTAIYGSLKEGETCVYATQGQARILLKSDGSITRYTTSDNTPSGTDISDTLGPNGWSVTTPWGMLSLTSAGLIIAVEGGGAITITPEGIGKFMATQVAVQGSIAAIAGDVATCIGAKCFPAPGVNTALYGPSGVLGLPSGNVFIAPAP